jgi:hypothetical protein
MDHVVQRAALHLLKGATGHLLRRGVYVDALLPVIHEEDRHRGIVEDGIQALLSFDEPAPCCRDVRVGNRHRMT